MARQAGPEDSVHGLTLNQGGSSNAKEESLDPETQMKMAPLSIGVGRAAWPQVGFQMCTSVAGAALLGLPYAMSLLGWAPGMIALLMGFAVTLWTSRITARFNTYGGVQHLRYRDMAAAVMGPRLGKAIVWPCQWINLFGALVSVFIQGGLSFKAIYTLCGGTSMTLTEFIAILGCVAMLFTQMPTFHSLCALQDYQSYGAALSDGGSFMPFFQLVVLNAIAGALIYAAPVTEHFETKVLDAKAGIWGFSNWFKRTALRCLYIFISAFIAALIPFFGDILALVGALGITPIDFLLPLVLYVFYTHPRPATHWLALNGALIALYTMVMIAGAAAAIRGIVLDAQTYQVFANL